jgi:hypothetical protein
MVLTPRTVAWLVLRRAAKRSAETQRHAGMGRFSRANMVVRGILERWRAGI